MGVLACRLTAARLGSSTDREMDRQAQFLLYTCVQDVPQFIQAPFFRAKAAWPPPRGRQVKPESSKDNTLCMQTLTAQCGFAAAAGGPYNPPAALPVLWPRHRLQVILLRRRLLRLFQPLQGAPVGEP